MLDMPETNFLESDGLIPEFDFFAGLLSHSLTPDRNSNQEEPALPNSSPTETSPSSFSSELLQVTSDDRADSPYIISCSPEQSTSDSLESSGTTKERAVKRSRTHHGFFTINLSVHNDDRYEQERNQLNALTALPAPTKEEKGEIRRLKNMLASFESRKKRNAEHRKLLEDNERLQEENSRLMKRIRSLETENARLKQIETSIFMQQLTESVFPFPTQAETFDLLPPVGQTGSETSHPDLPFSHPTAS